MCCKYLLLLCGLSFHSFYSVSMRKCSVVKFSTLSFYYERFLLSKKFLHISKSWRYFLYSLLKSFIILLFAFRYLIHQELLLLVFLVGENGSGRVQNDPLQWHIVRGFHNIAVSELFKKFVCSSEVGGWCLSYYLCSHWRVKDACHHHRPQVL